MKSEIFRYRWLLVLWLFGLALATTYLLLHATTRQDALAHTYGKTGSVTVVNDYR